MEELISYCLDAIKLLF